jgi:hypothetical protein
MGRTPIMQTVYFQGEGFSLGDLVSVRIDHGFLNSLEGTVQITPPSVASIVA